MERTQESNPSNPDIFEGRWKQMRGELRSWWSRLTNCNQLIRQADMVRHSATCTGQGSPSHGGTP